MTRKGRNLVWCGIQTLVYIQEELSSHWWVPYFSFFQIFNLSNVLVHLFLTSLSLCMGVQARVWRSEDSLQFWSLPSTLFERRSLVIPHCVCQSSWSISRGLPCLCHSSSWGTLGFRSVLLHWASRNWTQVLALAWRALDSLNYLPSLSILLFYNLWWNTYAFYLLVRQLSLGM